MVFGYQLLAGCTLLAEHSLSQVTSVPVRYCRFLCSALLLTSSEYEQEKLSAVLPSVSYVSCWCHVSPRLSLLQEAKLLAVRRAALPCNATRCTEFCGALLLEMLYIVHILCTVCCAVGRAFRYRQVFSK